MTILLTGSQIGEREEMAAQDQPLGATRFYERPRLPYRLAITIVLIVFATFARLWLERNFGVQLTYITFYPTVMFISLAHLIQRWGNFGLASVA